MNEEEIVLHGDKWAKIESIGEDDTAEIRYMEMGENEELVPTDETTSVKIDELTDMESAMDEAEEDIEKALEDADEEDLKEVAEELDIDIEDSEEEEIEDPDEEEEEDPDEEEEDLKKKAKRLRSAKSLIKQIFQKKEVQAGNYCAYLGYSNINFCLVREVIGTVAMVSGMHYDKEDGWVASEWIEITLIDDLTPVNALPTPETVDDFITEDAKEGETEVETEKSSKLITAIKKKPE